MTNGGIDTSQLWTVTIITLVETRYPSAGVNINSTYAVNLPMHAGLRKGWLLTSWAILYLNKHCSVWIYERKKSGLSSASHNLLIHCYWVYIYILTSLDFVLVDSLPSLGRSQIWVSFMPVKASSCNIATLIMLAAFYSHLYMHLYWSGTGRPT